MGWAVTRMGVGGLILGLACACGGGKATPQPTPSVSTGAADGLTPHAAVLHGQAAGNGTSGNASFRFGGDPALGIVYDRGPYLNLPGVGVEPSVSYPSGGPAMDYQASLTGLVPGWTYSYQAVARTSDYSEVLGAIRTFTTPTAAEPSWIRIFLPGSQPALVSLGTGFAVRGGFWGSPTWTMAFDGAGNRQWQRLGAAGDEALPLARSLGTSFLAVSRARKVATPTPVDWNSEVLRVDGSGAALWQHSLSGWLGLGAPTADGGAQLMGDLGQGPVWVRLAASGSVAWAASNDAGFDPLALLELEGGTVAFVGRSVMLPGWHSGIPVEVRKADGALAWRRVIWGGGEHAEAAEPAPGGGLVLAGQTWAGAQAGPLVARLASDGTLLWSVMLTGEVGPASGLAPAGDGGWLVSGAGDLGTPDTRYAWVAKLDTAGQWLWATRFFGKFQTPVPVLARTGGGFVLAAQVEVGYNTFGVGVILADAARRAGGAGTDVTLAATPVTSTVDLPTWADRAVVFPPFTAGGTPLRTTNLTAVQPAP
ncbi:PQQ-like beta-propeller repeat protein [Geothrix campi]|uniref:PQQ-like beta-propeller repeat protein n=1 Tax=Geothrix campi TaxID=2966450 RepID=UPI0021473CF2|nr:PQQ-like beta-propeller repeat protein [Geothrix sp. SG10]